MNGDERDELIKLKTVVLKFITDTEKYRDGYLNKKLEKLDSLPCAVHLEKLKNINKQVDMHRWLFAVVIIAIIGAFAKQVFNL